MSLPESPEDQTGVTAQFEPSLCQTPLAMRAEGLGFRVPGRGWVRSE